MIRRMSILAGTLSVLLCGSAVLLCIRSYSVSEEWEVSRVAPYGNGGEDLLELNVSPVRGSLEIQFAKSRILNVHALYAQFGISDGQVSKPGWSIEHRRPSETPSRDRDTIWKRLGFGLSSGGFSGESGDESWWIIGIPLWLAALATAAMPVRRGVAFLSRRRSTRRGLCPFCRYDLRASADRCPECGRPVPS
jgi:hypothetical protein